MPVKAKLRIGVGVVAICAVMVFLFLRTGRGQLVSWDKGELAASEQAYYVKKLSEVIDAWQKAGKKAQHDSEGRITEEYGVYLVIDTSRPALWIEENGEVIPEYRVELPGRVKWRLKHAAEDVRELQGQIRLKIRGVTSRRQYQEMFHLLGVGPKRRHIYARFSTSEVESESGPTTPLLSVARPGGRKSRDSYDSVIVSEAEYSRFLEQRRAAGNNGKERFVERPGAKNWSRWLKVEKRLYRQLEEKVIDGGWSMVHLRVNAGPDYKSARAVANGRKGGFINKLFGRYTEALACVRIDYLGDDIWYASTRFESVVVGLGRVVPLDMEFVVSGSAKVSRGEYDRWLKKGRKFQADAVQRKLTQ